MTDGVTLRGWTIGRAVSLLAGVGMMVTSLLTIEHYFTANFPSSISEGSICDINAFFNCDSSAFSSIAAIGGVPMGAAGLVVGALVLIGALLPSEPLERTNRSIALLNGAGVVALFLYSVLVLGSLCLLCTGYYLFSLLSLGVFWWGGPRRTAPTFAMRFLRPSAMHLVVAALAFAFVAAGFSSYHVAKEEARAGGVAARIVDQYFALPVLSTPSVVSPYWTARATERFEDAPIRVVEYGDFLCSDCRILYEQLARLKAEFDGQLNVAFQFFPLDAACNPVVDKDKHPGACELSYMTAYAPERFVQLHDEIFENLQAAKSPEWRADFARRHELAAGMEHGPTRELVDTIIATGSEYARTHEAYEHGIRSTPTMLINGRMVIGTLPYEHLRAIFQALVDRAEGQQGFLENWIES
jgi:uncharacterized membrane protein/predicted DsbA family dithiol-disulfide isomerase